MVKKPLITRGCPSKAIYNSRNYDKNKDFQINKKYDPHTHRPANTGRIFLSDRRRQMAHRQELADHLGISVKTIKAIEEGLFNYGIDQLFKVL